MQQRVLQESFGWLQKIVLWKPSPIKLSEGGGFVISCLQAVQKHRQVEPFTLARQVKGWTRDRRDVADAAYKHKQYELWTVKWPSF